MKQEPQAVNSPATTTTGMLETIPERKVCSYCRTKLDPLYYFCTKCAMPYKDVESVLPAVRPMMVTTEMLVTRKAPGVVPLFWTYFAVVVGVAIAGDVMFPVERPELVLVMQTVALFVTTCIFAGLHWKSLAVQFKRFGFNHPAALWGLLMLFPLLGFNYVFHGWVIREFGLEHHLLTDRLRDQGLTDGALIVLMCVFPALVEETAFRGLVQHWLMTALTPWRAVALAAALFTILHFTIISAPYIFAVGVLLGWIRWKTGSLYPAMLVHFLHNLVVTEFFFQ